MFVELRRKLIDWRIQLRIKSYYRMINRYAVWFAKHPVKEGD